MNSTGWSSTYQRHLREMAANLIPPGARVLDLACRNGDLLAALKPSRGVGVESDPGLIERARRAHPELTFVCSDPAELKLDETFDYILMADLLVYVEDVCDLFDRARSFSHEGTRFFIASHNAAWQGVLQTAEHLGLKAIRPARNWLGFDDLRGLCLLSDLAIEQEGTCLLLPSPDPISSFLNRWLAPPRPVRRKNPTWGLHWIQWLMVHPAGRPALEPLTTSVIVPTRNERGNIRPCVERMPELGPDTELIFVDGASNDGTVAEIEEVMRDFPDRKIRLIHQVDASEGSDPALQRAQRVGKMLPRGKADAVRKGFLAAQNDIVMILDADLTVAPEELPRFYAALASGKADFINGTRLVYPMEGGAMRFINLCGNKFFSVVFTWLLGQYVKDTLCGTKVCRRSDAVATIELWNEQGSFDQFGDFEQLFGASALGLRILDLPVHYRARVYGQPKIENFRHTVMLFRMVGKGIQLLKLGGLARKGLAAREAAHFDALVASTGEVWWGHQTPAGQRRLERRARLALENTAGRTLELGCGAGAFTEHLLRARPQLELVGCDVSPVALDEARRRCEQYAGASFVVKDATALDFPDATFDTVVGNSVLHHLPLDAALRECLRVLKPGGRVCFFEPNLLNPQVAAEKKVPVFGRWLQNTEDETALIRWRVEKLMSELGYTNVKVEPFDFLHPGTPRPLIGVVEKLGSGLEKVPGVREISGSLVLRAERPYRA